MTFLITPLPRFAVWTSIGIHGIIFAGLIAFLPQEKPLLYSRPVQMSLSLGSPSSPKAVHQSPRPAKKPLHPSATFPSSFQNPDLGAEEDMRTFEESVQIRRPSYPRTARQWRQEGEVQIQVTYDRSGRPTTLPIVLHSSGHPPLDSAALDSVSQSSAPPRAKPRTHTWIFRFSLTE